jgi:hypothetical protein
MQRLMLKINVPPSFEDAGRKGMSQRHVENMKFPKYLYASPFKISSTLKFPFN